MRVRTIFLIIYFQVLVFLVTGSQKKGVVHWAPSFLCDDFKVLDNMTWWYDFRMSLKYFHDNNICSSTIDNYKNSFVPMVWGFWKNTKIHIDGDARYILGFNEPNHKEQSNMTPEKAASAWSEVEKHSKGKPLVSPSAAVCGSKCVSTEIEWFDEFFRLCKDCRIDYLATHTYWCNANKVMTYLKHLYERYGRKIWLTEFACSKTRSPSRQMNFMRKILPQLEAADFIYRYSWYTARLTSSGFVTQSASLLEPDRSSLTPLGRYYNEFQGVSDKPKPTKPRKDVTTPSNLDLSEVGLEETLLILQSFTSNPAPWWNILKYIRENADKLPKLVAELYESLSKKQLKQRIKERFEEIVCVDPDIIQDSDIRILVAAIRDMSNEAAGGEKKNKTKGMLQMPKCMKS